MKFFATPLVTLVFGLGALGATISSSSGSTANTKNSGLNRCPTAYVVSTQVIQAGSISVNRSTYACPDDSLRQALQTPPPASKKIPSSSFGRREHVQKRNAAECRNAAPECQCGQDFQCECQNITGDSPVPTDCASLISSTTEIAQVTGASFLVQPDNFELISFGTCALEWTNLGCDTLEYCWDELADSGGVLNQLCFEEGGGTAGSCTANDDLWLLQSLRVGS